MVNSEKKLIELDMVAEIMGMHYATVTTFVFIWNQK